MSTIANDRMSFDIVSIALAWRPVFPIQFMGTIDFMRHNLRLFLGVYLDIVRFPYASRNGTLGMARHVDHGRKLT